MKSIIFGALLSLVSASLFSGSAAPELEAKASFGPQNPLNNVFNGQQNQVLITLSNPSKSDLTVTIVGGSFSKAVDSKHLRNTTSLKYNLPIPSSASGHAVTDESGKPTSFQIPYSFYSEFPVGDIGLTLWVEYADADKNSYRAIAFDDVVTVVEPPASWFDPALIFLYIILAAIFGGAGYFTFSTLTAGGKKKTKKSTVSAPVPVAETTGQKYEESWIPEHHLKARKVKEAGATSASESEGVSGAEGRGRKKNRK